MKRLLTLAWAICSLFLGGLIYLSFRTDSLLMFQWCHALSADSIIAVLRGYCLPYKEVIPKWAIFSLPQGLWLYAGVIGISCIWWTNPKKSYLWTGALSVLAFAMEFSQGVGLLRGNYDNKDLSLLILALGAALVTDRIFKPRRKWS